MVFLPIITQEKFQGNALRQTILVGKCGHFLPLSLFFLLGFSVQLWLVLLHVYDESLLGSLTMDGKFQYDPHLLTDPNLLDGTNPHFILTQINLQ